MRLAVDAGYRVHLRVLLVPERLPVARVAQRVVEGGYDVPEHKVRQRHQRLCVPVTAPMDATYQTRIRRRGVAATNVGHVLATTPGRQRSG